MWSQTGIAMDAWFILFTGIFLGPILKFFSVVDILHYVTRWRIRWAMGSNSCQMTQKEANYYFEGPPVYLSYMYANYNVTIMTAFFFAPILPSGLLLGAISILTNYMTDKYLLLKRHTAPSATGSSLCYENYHFFDVIIMVYALGQIVFDFLLRGGEFTGLPFIVFVIAVGHYLLGFHFIYKRIFTFDNEEHKKNSQTYYDIRDKFITEIDRCNPVSQVRATNEFINHLKGKYFGL